ncbi:MAG: hypothetical protein WCN98_02805 [Verrucomicrobiaceae bacterium]
MAHQEEPRRDKRIERRQGKLFRCLLFVPFIALFAQAYLTIGGLLISQTNNAVRNNKEDILRHDQKHNMKLALETRADLKPDLSKGFIKPLTDFFPHRTDGVVQPLWPWIAAWFAEPGQPVSAEDEVTPADREFFNRGRWFNVFMTLSFLVILGIASCRIFTLPAACNLTLLGGLGALLPRSAYFQPEPLYFILFFLTWVACVCALKRNSLWIYGLIGVLGGVAYMAKGSISPLLMIFVGVSSLRCVWELLSARWRGFVISSTNLWHWRNHLIGIVVLGAAHLMTVGPRLAQAQENFGDPFHSYPAYWMWMDSFGGPETIDDPKTCFGWMDRHNTRDELTEMLPADRPSPSNYWRTHSREEVLNRLKDGTWSRVSEFFWPPKQTPIARSGTSQKPWRGVLEWRGLYLAWLFLILLALLVVLFWVAPKPEHAGHLVFRHGTIATVLFVSGSFAAYSLAYGWYSPIARGDGDRFMLSLYLPLAFSLVWGAENILQRIRLRKGSAWIARGYLAAQWILFAAVVWRVVEILQSPKFYNG